MRWKLLLFLIFLVLIGVWVIYYFDIYSLLLAVGLITLIVCASMIIFVIFLFVILLYYLATKKPKLEEYSHYRLEDVKGKEDMK